jgi:acetolactate synthase-1/2/3 large subunit
MGQVDGGHLFGKALADWGVEKAFVLCGGHVMPVFYGMRNVGIEIIDMRHECSAVYAAIACTRASGKPSVVVTTAGPGAANTTTGMLEAKTLGMPILHIGGAAPMNEEGRGELQETPTLDLMKTACKWAAKVTNAKRIPEFVALAMREATDVNDPGPAYLELPVDLAFAKLEEDDVTYPEKPRAGTIPAADPAAIEAAADLLANAERPAAMIGDGARFSLGDKAGALTALSEYLNMPLSAGPYCRGMFGDELENPLVRTFGLRRADVVLAMGARFDFRLSHGDFVNKDATVIQVHSDATQIGFNLRADMGIVGGTGPVAEQLLDAVRKRVNQKTGEPWTGPLRKGLHLPRPEYESEQSPIHPARSAGDVLKFLADKGRDWMIVNDGGENAAWFGGGMFATRPGQLHWSGANGTIGVGPPAAIGAWAATREPVLLYIGDGSFGFYAMEMETAARKGVPLVCVISNDSAWGDIRLREPETHPEEMQQGGHCNTDLHPQRAYEKMVEMWGGHGEMVTEADEIIPAIERAVANGKPSIVNIVVDGEITIRH